jgi:hypothetical protein|tara:strand:- start:964 stop:1272 length:309 start_codon:yes stop_codon:yes gene_type:complete
MMNEKITISKDGDIPVSKLIEYFQSVLGVMLSPVRGQYNTFWLSGRRIDGETLSVVDGSKYYKLVFDNYGVEIVCNGMINGFHMKSQIMDWIREEEVTKKVA